MRTAIKEVDVICKYQCLWRIAIDDLATAVICKVDKFSRILDDMSFLKYLMRSVNSTETTKTQQAEVPYAKSKVSFSKGYCVPSAPA